MVDIHRILTFVVVFVQKNINSLRSQMFNYSSGVVVHLTLSLYNQQCVVI